MGRIKTGGSDISDGSRKSCNLASILLHGILGSQSITVILYKPQIIFVAEGLYRPQVKWISQSVGDHHCLCLFRPGRFQHGYINIILRNGYIHEYRNGAVLNSRSHGGRKAAGYGDDLIPTFDAALSKQRRGQGHKGKKIGR